MKTRTEEFAKKTGRVGVTPPVDGECDAVGHSLWSPCVGAGARGSQNAVRHDREREALRGTLHATRSTLVGTNETSIPL